MTRTLGSGLGSKHTVTADAQTSVKKAELLGGGVSSSAKTGPKGKQSEEDSQVTAGGRPMRISGGRVTKGTLGEQKTGCSVYGMLSDPSLGLTYFSVYTISLLLLLLQHAVA